MVNNGEPPCGTAGCGTVKLALQSPPSCKSYAACKKVRGGGKHGQRKAPGLACGDRQSTQPGVDQIEGHWPGCGGNHSWYHPDILDVSPGDLSVDTSEIEVRVFERAPGSDWTGVSHSLLLGFHHLQATAAEHLQAYAANELERGQTDVGSRHPVTEHDISGLISAHE